MTNPRLFPLSLLVSTAVIASGCVTTQGNLSKDSDSANNAVVEAKPLPVDLCADATDPTPAKKGKAAPLSYAQVVKQLEGGNEKKIKRSLMGKTVQVCVTKFEDQDHAGPNMFEVKPADLTYFVCKSASPNFKGGQITAKITGYEFSEEMNQVLISIDRCTPTNQIALAAMSTKKAAASPPPMSAPAPARVSPAVDANAKPGMDASGNVIDPSKVEAGSGRKVKGLRDWEGEITGNPVPGSKFDQLQIGMSFKQATDIVGEPTDSGAYVTGKAFIPFFFGSDAARTELTYKGKGRLIFASGGLTSSTTGGNLIWVINSANEPGYR